MWSSRWTPPAGPMRLWEQAAIPQRSRPLLLYETACLIPAHQHPMPAWPGPSSALAMPRYSLSRCKVNSQLCSHMI